MIRSLKSEGFHHGLAVIIAFGASSCSMQSANDGSSLYVDLSSLQTARSARLALSESGDALGLAAFTPPTAESGFACYAVNVTGPGIVDTSRNPDADPMLRFYNTLNVPGTYCAYRGIVTPPLYLNSTGNTVAELQVPPGGVRLVQVVGVADPLVCARGVVDDPPGATDADGSRFFEVGRAVLNDVFGDRSVDVRMNWPTAATDQAKRAMDCGDCALVDRFHSAASAAGIGTYSKYAQRIPAAPGKFLRSAELNLALAAADSVTVTVYTSGAGAATPEVATGFSRTLALAAGTAGSVNFDWGAANGAMQMQTGTDYWLVLEAVSSSNQTSWQYTTGTGVDAVRYTGSAWGAMSTNAGFDFRVRECN